MCLRQSWPRAQNKNRTAERRGRKRIAEAAKKFKFFAIFGLIFVSLLRSVSVLEIFEIVCDCVPLAARGKKTSNTVQTLNLSRARSFYWSI